MRQFDPVVTHITQLHTLAVSVSNFTAFLQVLDE